MPKDRNIPPAARRVLDTQRYKERKARAISYLGGVCVACGAAADLEFDHKDPAAKSFTITTKLGGGAWDKIREELDKCQLLCGKCHHEKSLKDYGKQDATKVHGTLSSYRVCRCDLCKAAWNKYHADYKKKRRRRLKT